MNKKIFILLPALALLLGGCNTNKPTSSSQGGSSTPASSESGSSTETVAVTGVELNQSEVEIEIGNSVTLQATVKPNNATNKKVTWTSSKPAVATVQNGKVTAVAAGETVVTVTTEDGNKTATCTVTVPEATNYGTEEKPLTPDEVAALVKDLKHQEWVAEPVWAEGVVYTSSYYSSGKTYNGWLQNSEYDQGLQLYGVALDEGITGDFTADDAMVGYTVKIHGYIQKYSGWGEFNKKTVGEDTIVPTIKKMTAPSGDPTGVRLITEAFEMDAGTNRKLSARLVPLSAAGTITFESDTPAVAKIEGNKVVGVSAGKAKIKAKCGTLVSDEIEVTVKAVSYLAKLDFTSKAASHSSYKDSWKYGDWTITAGANNGAGWAFVKFGGKEADAVSRNGSAVSPKITTAGSKVTINIVDGSLSKSGMGVAEYGVKAYSDADLKTEVASVVGTVAITNKAASIVLSGTFPANSYYKIYFNTTNTTTTNGVVCVGSIQID